MELNTRNYVQYLNQVLGLNQLMALEPEASSPGAVIVDSPTPEQEHVLRKILKALEIEDWSVVEQVAANANPEILKTFAKVISFGCVVKKAGALVVTEPLAQLTGDDRDTELKARKMRVWNELKPFVTKEHN